MAEFKRRVYSPRGDRKGGGLIAQVTIDEAEVQHWLGPIGAPSASDRVSLERAISWSLTLLLREVVAHLAAMEVARVSEVGSGGGGLEGVSEASAG